MAPRRACDLVLVCCFPVGAAFAQAELQVLRGSRGAPGDQFGFSVDADGDHILVGAPNHDGVGIAYAFARDDQGTTTTRDDVWAETCTLSARDSDPGDFFGGVLEFDGRLAVLSSILDDQAGNDAGAAYLF